MLPVPEQFWRAYAVISGVAAIWHSFGSEDAEKVFKAGTMMVFCLAVDSILSAIKKLRDRDDA